MAFAIALATCMTARQIALATDSKPTGLPESQTIEMKILSADSSTTIGSSHITISTDRSNVMIKGETRYLDGQHDDEVERIRFVNGGFRLETYQHSFFGTDGALIMSDTLDIKSRIATCSRRENGDMKVRKAESDFPADTFGGGSELLIAMADLRTGDRKMEFHAFACVPGPHVFQIDASVPEQAERWPFYPGNLIRLDLRPDLGIGMNLVFAPFLPKLEAWFDPHDNWNYVGGEFNRYFGGSHVFQVLVPSHS